MFVCTMISAPGRLTQEDCWEFKAIPTYIVNPSSSWIYFVSKQTNETINKQAKWAVFPSSHCPVTCMEKHHTENLGPAIEKAVCPPRKMWNVSSQEEKAPVSNGSWVVKREQYYNNLR